MDKIFDGVLKSENCQAIKMRVLQKIIAAASKPREVSQSEVVSLLNSALKEILYNESKLIVQYSFQIFNTWSEKHRNALHEVFECNKVEELLQNHEIVNKDQILPIIIIGLHLLQDKDIYLHIIRTVKTLCPKFLYENQNVSVLSSVLLIFREFTQCIPDEKHLSYLSCTIICCLMTSPIEVENIDNVQQTVNEASSFLQTLWSANEECRQRSFMNLYSALSSIEKSSLCLALVVEKTPLDKVDDDTQKVVNESSNEVLVTIGCKVVDWLKWPDLQIIDVWILNLFYKIAAAKLFSVLTVIFEAKIEEVIISLHNTSNRGAALNVAQYMLLSYQVSPIIFIKSSRHFPTLINKLREENTEDSRKVLGMISHICHYLIYINPGFPELYEPISTSLKDTNVPFFSEVQSLLKSCRWSCDEKESHCRSVSFQKRQSSMVGLINYGLTCYVNSVLQALYMTKCFCSKILESSVQLDQQPVTLKLQEVFAYLMFSERQSYSPKEFVEVSRAPWFDPYQQQDCSEFLRHLLDTLSIEENAAKCSQNQSDDSEGSVENNNESIVDKVFGGRLQIRNKCLKCNSCSIIKEDFVDLALSIPRSCNCNEVPMETGDGSTSEVHNTEKTNAFKTPYDLYELIESYFQPENLTGENQYFCETCQNLENGERQVTMLKPPNHLIITLLRFTYSSVTNRKDKIMQEVIYPSILTLPYTIFSNGSFEDESEGIEYYLYSVIVHSGSSTESGHYYTYAKELNRNSDICSEQLENWYCFNDDSVTFTTLANIMSLSRRTQMDTGYVLFYKRKSTCNNAEKISQTLGISRSLKQQILKDNSQYLHDEEEESKRQRKKSFETALVLRDFNGDNHSPGGCGGSAGGMDFNPSWFVY